MSHFHFVTNWTFAAPVDQIWTMINEPERFPTCWPRRRAGSVA